MTTFLFICFSQCTNKKLFFLLIAALKTDVLWQKTQEVFLCPAFLKENSKGKLLMIYFIIDMTNMESNGRCCYISYFHRCHNEDTILFLYVCLSVLRHGMPSEGIAKNVKVMHDFWVKSTTQSSKS